MSIASLNAAYLMTTEEKANLELERTIIDQNRESLANFETSLYTEYTAEYQKIQVDSTDSDSDSSGISSKAWQQFYAEYQNEVAKIQAQDKKLEQQRTNIDTKIEAVTTTQESLGKMKDKNVETDFKGFN